MAERPLIQILQEDGPSLVVLKPAGVLTQGPPGVDSLEVRIKRFLKKRDRKEGSVYLGLVHRLDRPSSGAMVFAKHARAARKLSEQFEARRVQKIYWAVVSGKVEPADGTWVDWLYKLPTEGRSTVVTKDHPDAREAILHYRTLAVGPWGTWLSIKLETGRTHQVRIQASSRGYPILGDDMYGSKAPFGTQYEDERLRAIALHARKLSFSHPMTNKRVVAEAPVGKAWRDLKLPFEAIKE